MTSTLRFRHPAVLAAAVAVAVGATLGATATPAAGQAILDANCPGPREVSFTSLAGGNARFAQTFTAQNSGALTAGQMEITKGASAGDYVMRVQSVDASGTPTNDVLAEATIPDSSVPMGDSILAANFASPAAVTAGQQYALVLTRPGSSSLVTGGRTGDDCPGSHYFSASQTEAFTSDPGSDLIFAVFVEAPAAPGSQAVGRNLTLDANKNNVKEGKKVTLSGHLESAEQACESGQTVELQRKRPKQTAFTTFAQLQTNAQGDFSLKKKLKKTFEFRAQVVETAACLGQTSNTEKVKVKKKK